jgi:hypothetical protein
MFGFSLSAIVPLSLSSVGTARSRRSYWSRRRQVSVALLLLFMLFVLVECLVSWCSQYSLTCHRYELRLLVAATQLPSEGLVSPEIHYRLFTHFHFFR